jgi:D-amino-acid dehydrogenase
VNADSADVLVVGGGAIGVCAAYELARRGCTVTLLERGDRLGAACSAGNAGLICPSHSAPLATPGARREALGSLVRRDSPLAVRPRLDTLPWLARFALAARRDRAERGREAIHRLSVASLDLHSGLSPLGTSFERRGILKVCETPRGLDEAARTSRAEDVLSGVEARTLEPSLGPEAAGAVFHRDEAHVDPALFVEAVATAARAAGAVIRTSVTVSALRVRAGSVVVETGAGDVRAQTVVVAAGVWAGGLARSVGVFLPLIPGKGHHVEFATAPGDPRLPLLFHDARLSVTPFRGRIRVAGRVELTGPDPAVSKRQAGAITAAAGRLLPGLAGREVLHTWAGLRPCTPDGLPAIGRSERSPAVVFATGHAMKGVALAPVTAHLVAGLVRGEPVGFDLTPFSPDRFRPLLRPR